MIDSELTFLLTEEDKEILTKDIESNGYYPITKLINQFKNSLNSDHDYSLIDAELVILFDLRTNYKIFITDNEIFSRDDIIKKYDLNKFKIEPEQLFNNQKIEIIDNDYYIFDEETETRKTHGKIYNTKIYLGKDKWKDFMITFRLLRSLSFITESRLCIKDSEKKDSEKKEMNYIDKVLDQVFNNGT